MERRLYVTKVLSLEEREYTAKSGEKKVFVSRTLLLSDSLDTFSAELIGENARRQEWPLGVWANVQLTCCVREYTDKNGKARFSNELTINRIGL